METAKQKIAHENFEKLQLCGEVLGKDNLLEI